MKCHVFTMKDIRQERRNEFFNHIIDSKNEHFVENTAFGELSLHRKHLKHIKMCFLHARKSSLEDNRQDLIFSIFAVQHLIAATAKQPT
jgi:hypothetical protein